MKPLLILVQKNLPPAYLLKLSSVHPLGNIPKVQVKKGGTLRRGWTSKTHEEAVGGSGKSSVAAGKAYADSLKINHFGNTLVIEIVNPVKYASYVEYGHRTANHKGWVQGRFMLTTSEQELENITPKVLESKIKKFLGECMK